MLVPGEVGIIVFVLYSGYVYIVVHINLVNQCGLLISVVDIYNHRMFILCVATSHLVIVCVKDLNFVLTNLMLLWVILWWNQEHPNKMFSYIILSVYSLHVCIIVVVLSESSLRFVVV